MFNELIWEEYASSGYNNLQEKITINYERRTSLYIYLYFPDLSEYISESDWYYNEIKLIPRYLTSCPVNYVSNCTEDYDDLLIGTSIKNIGFDDIRNGGYLKYNLVTHKTNSLAGIIIGDEKRIYDLTDINIMIENYNDDIFNAIRQNGMILISYNDYSDDEIVSVFE